MLSGAKHLTARPSTSFRVTPLVYQSHAAWFSSTLPPKKLLINPPSPPLEKGSRATRRGILVA
jgi:hypothetical protein